MSFPRYEKYKDSGVEWLGEVPEHWEVKRVRHLLRQSYDGLKIGPFGSQLTSQMLVPSGYKVFGQENVIANDFTLGERFITEEKLNELAVYEIKSGDILITMMGTSGRCAIAPDNLEIGIMDSHLLRMRVIDEIRHRFIQLLIDESVYIAHQIRTLGKGSIMHGLNSSIIKELILTVPSVVEQDSILSFLNRETSKIDELIAEQQRLIELLKEKRQAVISHAVTKGLNPDAPMKDSGVEWLGEVPAHWEVCALKRMAKEITDGAHISPETENGIYGFVSTKDVCDDGIDFENCLRTSEKSYEYLVRTGCKPSPGDVLFSKDGTIGRTVVVKENRDFVVASSLIIIRPDMETITPDFLNYLCQSNVVVCQVESFVKGAGLPRLSIQNLLKIVGVFPPITEQKLITDQLNLVLGQMASLLTTELKSVALLQERRTALISAAVTGKIDVRKFI